LPVNPLAAAGPAAHLVGMAEKDKSKEERLAEALRENLRRRKAQARTLSESGKKEQP